MLKLFVIFAILSILTQQISAKTVQLGKNIKEIDSDLVLEQVQELNSFSTIQQSEKGLYDKISDFLYDSYEYFSPQLDDLDDSQDVWQYIETQLEKEQQEIQQNQKIRKLVQESQPTMDEHIHHQKHQMILKNYQNIQYYAKIEMGTHKQIMTVDLDTGSHQLWIPTIDCKSKEGIISCHKENDWYNYQESQSYIASGQNQTLQYAKGQCNGQLGSENISVQNVTVMQDNILFVDHVDKHIRRSLKSDGILGLSNKKSIDNFIDIAYKENKIESNKFVMRLNWKEGESQFIFDDIPEEIEQNAIYVQSSKKNYWTIHLQDIKINDKSYSPLLSQKDAVIDSGTSYILLNKQLFDELWTQLFETGNCQTNQSGSFYMCKCIDELNSYNYPNIDIVSTGVKFTLRPQDYLDHTKKGEYCNLEVRYIPGRYPLMLFGDAFMRKYTVVYNKQANEIGFVGAEKIENEQNNTIMIILMAVLFIVISVSFALIMLNNKKQGKFKTMLQKYEKEQLNEQERVQKQQDDNSQINNTDSQQDIIDTAKMYKQQVDTYYSNGIHNLQKSKSLTKIDEQNCDDLKINLLEKHDSL